MKTTHQPAFAGKICGFDFLLLKNILKCQKYHVKICNYFLP